MQVDDFLQDIPREPFNIPQIAWLAGAAAGLRIASNRSPSWLWREFFEDIYEMIHLVEDITPAEPGTAPQDGDGLIGSAFEALGGYVSVIGEVTPEGLYFRVPLNCQENVAKLMKGLSLVQFHGEFIIPKSDLLAFLRLVPLEGPIAEWLEIEEVP